MKNISCPSGKVVYDKRGATTMANLTMKLHRIKMRAYECNMGNHWHLATIGKHRQFRHNDSKLGHKGGWGVKRLIT